MSCDITTNIKGNCNNNIGGIRAIWLGNGAEPKTWYKYELAPQTANVVEEYILNPAGGIVGFEQVLTIRLNKMHPKYQLQIKRMAQSNDMAILIQTNNSLTDGYKIHGRGGFLQSGSTYTGVSLGDQAGSELVIRAESKQSIIPVALPQTLLVATITGTFDNLSGCWNSSGGGAFQNIDFSSTTNWGPFEPDIRPDGKIYQMRYPFNPGGVKFRVEAEITTTYTDRAFDGQGDLHTTWELGSPFGRYPGPFKVYMTTDGEPTTAGIETTFTALGRELNMPTGTDLPPIYAATTQDCSTTPSGDRVFADAGTITIKYYQEV